MLNRTIYSGLSYLLAPFAVARLCLLSGKHPGYRQNLGQRFGFTQFPQSVSRPLWLHAVSVGEVIASEPFVRAVQARHPDLPICITTATPTGAEQVRRSFGDSVMHSYAPYDLPGSVKRFVDRLNPIGLVMMETELWPNWISELSETRVLPSILINGRMSEKSARGYGKLGTLAAEMFGNINCISAQTEQDAARFRELGARQVQVSGNLKADFVLDGSVKEQAQSLASLLGVQDSANTVIAASTHPGEDEIILDAFAVLRSDYPQLRLLMVPRHPERASEIAGLLDVRRLGYVLRSQEIPCQADQPVVVCDRLGELRALYGLASIALLGGTLVDHGGHNPLEPAAWEVALIAGPSQRNFDQSFTALEACGAMQRVHSDADSIRQVIELLINQPAKARQMGKAAKDYLHANRGATEKNIELFERLFDI